MKPRFVSQTQYFIALFPVNMDESQQSSIHVLVEEAWRGKAFQVFDIDSESLSSFLSRRLGNSPDSDCIKWFSSIEEAYQFITLNESKFFKAMGHSGLDLEAFEWSIMTAKTHIHTIATESENNIDKAVADKTLEELKSKMTPEQLSILKKNI